MLFTSPHFLVTTFFSGLLAFMLGMIWYHPAVMGRKWLKARGMEGQDMKPTPLPFVVSFMLWLVAATFFSFLAAVLNVTSAPGYLCLASLLWVGFAMPPTLMGALYTGYPMEAMSIDSSYQLAGYYLLGVTHIVAAYLRVHVL
ncbi:MAG TPA: DUF1761 domain-containing protein [Patescibacteria group bacterium]|jgi:hypothetical protein|nr:DUF1761 domain-containing protein [Patescibacteria group bacterium]